MRASPLPLLIGLSPGSLEPRDVPNFLNRCRSAVGAGLPGLLLREPRLDDQDWLRVARELRSLLDLSEGARWFGVHDRVHLAQEVRADAIHLGFRSLEAAVVRGGLRSLEGSPLIGVSSHAGDESTRCEHADYRFLSPVLETASKPRDQPGYRRALGFTGFAESLRSERKPTYALGGIEPEHVGRAMKSGACGVAVLSGILSHADPGARTRAYLAEFQRA